MSISSGQLVDHFRRIHLERMQGLPFLNPALDIQAVGFRDLDDHRLGVLISPWFMNLVLLPGTDEWQDRDQGARIHILLPAEGIDFNVTHDETLGTYLTAVLFRTVSDFPDQDTAVAIAADIMVSLFEAPEPEPATRLSRRELFTRGD